MTKLVKPEEYTDPVDRAIHDVFYDPVWGQGGVEKTWRRLKEVHPDMYITQARVRAFLQKQKIKIDRQPIQHNTFVPQQRDQEFQADVMHFGKRKPMYALCCIDIFTKKGMVYPMTENNSTNVAINFQKFMKENGIPASVSTDGGPEFKGAKGGFEQLCKFYDIQMITLRSYPRFIDRFIRTIREGIWDRQQTMDIRKWTDALPFVLQNYNGSIHTATGVKPGELEANPGLDKLALQNMKERAAKFRPKPVLQLYDHVRLLKATRDWKASEDPKWDDEIRTVTAIHHTDSGTMYDISHFKHPVIRADLVYVGPKEEKKPSRLPDLPNTRPLEFRLTPKQESQATQYEEYLPKCLRILNRMPKKTARSFQLQLTLKLPPEIGILAWARLYPTYLVVNKATISIRPGFKIPRKWLKEDEDEPEAAPVPEPPPEPPVPEPPAPKRQARDKNYFAGLRALYGDR
jgi:hypothetical protein